MTEAIAVRSRSGRTVSGRQPDTGEINRALGLSRVRLWQVTLRDYEQWLHRYDDPRSALSWRLRQVQAWLRQDLDHRSGPIRLLSVCAGDGRDIIDVLSDRKDSARVKSVLLEAHPGIADRARARAAEAGISGLMVRTSDAADTSAYVDAVPADLVLLVGIFGNISRTDVSTTIATAPQFCAPGATVIWSRGRDRDDINDSIRAEFGDAGFTELGYAESALPSRPALGSMRYDGPPVPLDTTQHLFTFWR